jgi:uncharacterized integral membrane protein (TIGR00698 family)
MTERSEPVALVAASPNSFSRVALWLIPVAIILLLLWGNPLAAIATGAGLSVAANRSLIANATRYGKLSLQTAIVLLGFNLDARNMWQVSHDFAGIIVLYVLLTFACGLVLGRILKVDGTLTRLIAAGTAICGGTAIAALGPVIKARADQIALALAIVFFLNMVALIVFPLVGDALSMTQAQFGVWSALAVHDTSSVVATATVYGHEAAQVAATLKLGRTLWIIPLLLTFSVLEGAKGTKIRIPLFILFFVLASIGGSLARSHLSVPPAVFDFAQLASKALIVLALFFIGLEFTRDALRKLHGRVLWQALALWAAVVPITLLIALHYG